MCLGKGGACVLGREMHVPWEDACSLGRHMHLPRTDADLGSTTKILRNGPQSFQNACQTQHFAKNFVPVQDGDDGDGDGGGDGGAGAGDGDGGGGDGGGGDGCGFRCCDI